MAFVGFSSLRRVGSGINDFFASDKVLGVAGSILF